MGQLEVLLVFFNNKHTAWAPVSVGAELRSHETITRQQIEKLTQSGFLKKISDNQFIYGASPELDENVELLSRTYKEMSVAVIGFIYEKPTDKLKALADAFKIKKD
ncbi:MAG: hypothetical protein ACJ76H_11340 [Bacteriovoracaceae bacterium]